MKTQYLFSVPPLAALESTLPKLLHELALPISSRAFPTHLPITHSCFESTVSVKEVAMYVFIPVLHLSFQRLFGFSIMK